MTDLIQRVVTKSVPETHESELTMEISQGQRMVWLQP